MFKCFIQMLLGLSFLTVYNCLASEAIDEVINSLKGKYAHYDVVAYYEKMRLIPMKSLVISYGFTEFKVIDGKLYSTDTFCHANHKTNLPMKSSVPDSFTQAILPRTTQVDVKIDEGIVKVWRPATPTSIGIKLENENEPLPKDPNDPRIYDHDQDGKPGVTVNINIFWLLPTELYIARREIFSYDLRLMEDGSLVGDVWDKSEQLIVGASLPILLNQRSPDQHPDLSLSPIFLVPVSEEYDCKKLMDDRDLLFPPEPKIWKFTKFSAQ